MLDIGITRPAQGRVIAGVCAGLAPRFGLDPLILRVVFAVSLFFGGAGALVYAVLWVLMPSEK
ncbi:Phage shock protein PspC (stress-responsive transcriptional regulator) [Raineyella antarctica]|uniref:Phage shock protein PspC (Stress-responsive transcriptional regulator) n=1 Tax=Raineyella antarctica TaxID=1577474 RepID=A0A1G6GF62_9ACTN|nr:PspC domain-containing protein [Raineyella antarctica]SDB79786.1 Phage shock protein PspC (stress-responsive transcriptional regulator) [Raineyella antarctica]